MGNKYPILVVRLCDRVRRVLLLRILLGTTFPGYLSSASLVVGIKTLVAARHMITQNLGGKRISVGQKGWQNVLIVAVANFFGFHILEQSKNYSLYRGSKANFAVEECYISSAVSKI